MSPSRKSRRKKLKIVCKYRNFIDEKGDSYPLPMVPIRLSIGEDGYGTFALVDSGASGSFITKDDAEILGLPLEEEGSAIGAGGAFKTFVVRANIELMKGVRPIFPFTNCLVQVPQDEGAIPYVILGRDTIFSVFEITFREREQKFVLKSY